jgi:hypothetical protein
MSFLEAVHVVRTPLIQVEVAKVVKNVSGRFVGRSWFQRYLEGQVLKRSSLFSGLRTRCGPSCAFPGLRSLLEVSIQRGT